MEMKTNMDKHLVITKLFCILCVWTKGTVSPHGQERHTWKADDTLYSLINVKLKA